MIHKFEACGSKMVLDVNTGAVHVIDDVTFDVLDYYKKMNSKEIIEQLKDKYNANTIEEAISELKELEQEGFLYSTGEEYKNIAKGWTYRKSFVKSLCLHIAHDCNLRCQYCFASTGEYKGKRELMSLEVGKKSIDFLMKASGSRKNLEVDFFGGEPLMNFDVVKGILEYGREQEKIFGKRINFTLTTNCVLLDKEKRDWINENIYNVVLSLDGRKEVHDRMRYRADGTGSYDTIVKNIAQMVKERGNKSFYVRGTFTKYNLDFAKDVLHMADLGFKHLSMEPVVADPSEPYALSQEDLPAIFKEYDELAEEYIKRQKEGNGFTFFHFTVDLGQGPCALKRVSGCGSGSEYVAISPSGDIYPCHQFVGEQDFKMGTVFTGIEKTDMQHTFHDINIFTKEDCTNCWAKFYCSGGCVANAYKFNNDISKPEKISCELERKRVECALGIKAQLLEE